MAGADVRSILSLHALDRGRRPIAVLLVGAAMAILVRYPLMPLTPPFLPRDLNDRIRWYDFIARNGNFAALQHDFFEYNMPYYYLMAAASLFVPEASVVHVKLISIAFDFALALFVGLCVRVGYPQSRIVPILAALAALLAPTVVLNNALWGQNDSIHTTFLAACLYCLLTGRRAAACIAFGVAVACKLSAFTLAPLLLWLLVKQDVGWRHLLLSPTAYLASLLPAWLSGRALDELLLIDFRNMARQQVGSLSENAPNFYRWIPEDFYPGGAGEILTAGVVSIVAVSLYKSRAGITAERLVLLATFSALAVPYFLPRMHERYFFPADVVAIVLAFHSPRYWCVPIVVGLTSLSQYAVAMFGAWIIVLLPGVPLPLPAGLPAAALQVTVAPLPLLVILVLLGRRILLTFGAVDARPAEQGARSAQKSEAEDAARRRHDRGGHAAGGEHGGGDRRDSALPQDRQPCRQQRRPQDVEDVDGSQRPEGERIGVERRPKRRERGVRRE